jgi:endonuclease/exonuclease/phosphatase family metal-dependent hydrolase
MSKSLTVLQWNVWFKETADNVLSLIKEVDADVLCLQELTSTSTINPDRDIPKEITGLGYQHSYVETIQRPDIRLGNGIFSKYPIVNKRQVYVQREDKNVKDYSRENRIYVECRVKAGQTEITVGTVHLSYTDRFAINTDRKRELNKLLMAIKPNTNKFILTGDFNALPDSEVIHEVEKVLVSAGPDYSQKSWTTKPFSHNDFNANTLDWRLDYAFTTKDLKINESEIIKTDFSDHLPILISIEVN